MLWAFVTDVIDYQEYITEKREDGTVIQDELERRRTGK